jgi:hypothetical protein
MPKYVTTGIVAQVTFLIGALWFGSLGAAEKPSDWDTTLRAEGQIMIYAAIGPYRASSLNFRSRFQRSKSP